MRADPNIRQPKRVIVGHCPECGEVLVIENGGEVWPYVDCVCGWGGTTQEVANRARYERGGYVSDAYRPDVTA
jgi:hypothetical protein